MISPEEFLRVSDVGKRRRRERQHQRGKGDRQTDLGNVTQSQKFWQASILFVLHEDKKKDIYEHSEWCAVFLGYFWSSLHKRWVKIQRNIGPRNRDWTLSTHSSINLRPLPHSESFSFPQWWNERHFKPKMAISSKISEFLVQPRKNRVHATYTRHLII